MTQATITIGVDGAEQSRRQIDTVGDALRGMNDTSLQGLWSQINSVEGALGALRGTVGAALGALAALGAVGAFAGWIKSAIDATDAADDLAQKTGIAVEDLAGLELAFQKGGMEAADLESSMSKLSKQIADGNDAFEKLGVKTKDASGALKTNKAMLYELADEFAGMEDGVQKAALAQEAFGKSGAAMIPLLNGGSEGLREMDEMARKLGLSLSKDAVAKAGDFNDTLDLIKLGGEGVARGIAAQLLPTLSNLAGQFLTSMTTGDGLRKTADFLSASLKILYTSAVGIVEVFSTAGKAIAGFAAIMTTNLMGSIEGLKLLMKGDVAGAFEVVKRASVSAKGVLLDTANDIGSGWAKTADTISKTWAGGSDEMVDSMVDIRQHSRALALTAAEAAKQAEKAAKARQEEAKLLAEETKLLGEMSGVTGSYMNDLNTLVRIRDKGNVSEARYVELVTELIAKQPAAKKWMDDQKKSMEDRAKLVEGAIGQDAESLLQLQDRARGLELEIELYGRSAEAAVYAEAAKVRATASSLAISEEYRAELVKQAEELERIAGLVAKKEALVASKKAADQIAEDQRQLWGDIERTAHDTFISIFDSGKSAFDRLKDTLKNGLYELLYQMTVKKWIINLSTSSSGTSLAQMFSSIGSGGSIFGTASNLFSVGKSIFGGFQTGLSAFLGQGVSYIGNALGSNAMFSFGQGMQGFSAGGIGSGISGSAAGAGSGFASALSVGGWIAAGMAAADALYKKGYDPNNGSTNTALTNPLIPGAMHNNKIFQALGMNAQWANMFSGASVVTALFGRKNPEVKSSDLWGNLTAATGFQGAQRDHWEAKGGVFRSDKEGTAYTPVTTEVYEFLSDTYADLRATTKALAEALGADASSIATRTDAINVAIGKTEEETQKNLAAYFEGLADTMAKDLVPSLAQFQQKGESAASTLQRLAADYTTIDAVLQSIGMTMGAVGVSSLGARERLIEASGGLEAFAVNAEGFAQNFLTEAERLAPVQKYVTEQLAAMGLASVDTRDEFKSVVLGLDLTTEAGAKQYGALMQLQAAFAQVYPVIEAVAESADNAAARLAEVNKGYQDQIDEILRGRMSPDDRRAAEIQGMDASTVALYDRLAALRAEVAALDEAAARAQAVADERIELQDQLDALTLSSVALLDKQRAALDASNRSLFDQVQAATRAQAVLEERKSVQEQLDSLTLTSTQLLEKQRNALDESNRALFDQVQIAQKAAAVLAERTSLQDRLDELTLSPAQLQEKQRAALDESNRALFDQVKAAEALTGARTALTSAYQSESDAIKATTDRVANFAKTLRGLRDSTLLGNLSPLTPMQKYQEARAQYERTVAAARGGDEAAQGRYADAYRAFLEASQLVNASGAQYQQDFAFAQAATEEAAKWAEMQVDVGQASLEALRAQVAGLIDVQGAVLTVRDAVNNLSALLIAAGQPVPTGGQGNAIESIYKSVLGRQADPAGMEFWTKQLQAGISIRDITEAFKRSDEYLMQQAPIRAQDYGTGASTALVAEIKSLREENGSMRAELKGLRDDLRKQTGDQIQAEAAISDRSTNKLTQALTEAVRAVGQREPARVAPV